MAKEKSLFEEERILMDGKGAVVRYDLVFKNTLLVPDLCLNLLSINAVTENDG